MDPRSSHTGTTSRLSILAPDIPDSSHRRPQGRPAERRESRDRTQPLHQQYNQASSRPRGPGQGETWTDFLRSTAETTDAARYLSGTYGRLDAAQSAAAEYTRRIQAGRHTQASSGTDTGTAAQSTSRKRLLSETATNTRRDRPGSGSAASRSTNRGLGTSMENPVNLDSPSPQPPSRQVIFPRRPSGGGSASSTGAAPARWQPDEDSTECPVCHTAFSWYFRKHHCRKCGRLVCGNCSPHRISIPRKFIAQPPVTTPRTPLEQQYAGLYTAMREAPPDQNYTVRVCNPCVPDPNLNPPSQLLTQDPNRPRSTSAYGAPQSGASNAVPPPSFDLLRRQTDRLPGGSSRTAHSRSDPFSSFASSRDRTGSHSVEQEYDPVPPTPTRIGSAYRNEPSAHSHTHRRSASHDYPHSATSSTDNTALRQRHRQMMYDASLRAAVPEVPSSAAPAAPPPQPVDESEQCPICLRALPPLDAITGSDDTRTAHIVQCITRAERRHSGVHNSQSPTNRRSMDSPAHLGTSANSRPMGPPPPYSGSIGRSGMASLHARSRPLPPTPISSYDQQRDRQRELANHEEEDDDPSPPAGLHDMLRFRASATDCINVEEKGGSAPECIICFEEFEVGQGLGRLECLCRFHANCLDDWWRTKGTNACPTHMIS